MRPKIALLGHADIRADECTFSLRPAKGRTPTFVYSDPEISVTLPGGTSFTLYLKPLTQEGGSKRKSQYDRACIQVTDEQLEVVRTILEDQTQQ